ncbi:MAG: hypothetical protein ABSB29_03875 [Nitrososphaerales archaeon]|jgi:hypothetical protein
MSEQTETVERVRQWFVDFITYFRTEFSRLPPDVQKMVATNTNYLPNCQIEVLWLERPEYQFVIKSNFKDRPDMEITIHGPLSDHEFLACADELASSTRWARPIRNDPQPTGVENQYSEALASQLHSFTSMVRNSLFNPKPRPGQLSGMLVGEAVWVEISSGNLVETDYVQAANKRIEEIRSRYASASKPTTQQVPQKPKKRDGFVTFFYPPLEFGQRQKPTPSAILRGVSFHPTSLEKAFDTSFNGIPIIVNRNGLLFIGADDKETALRILNTIMAIGTLMGLGLYAVREHEIGEGDYDREKMVIAGHGYPLSSMRMMQSDFFFGRQFRPSIPTEPSKILQAIQISSGLFTQHKLVEELRLYVESYTHLQDSEYAQSFILSWSIIERHIYELWGTKLELMDMDEDRIAKLRGQTIDFLIEALNVSGDMSETEYEGYMELKNKRNKFIHRGKPILKADAEKCFSIAQDIVRKRIAT